MTAVCWFLGSKGDDYQSDAGDEKSCEQEHGAPFPHAQFCHQLFRRATLAGKVRHEGVRKTDAVNLIEGITAKQAITNY